MQRTNLRIAEFMFIIAAIALLISGCPSSQDNVMDNPGMDIKVENRRYSPGDTVHYSIFLNSIKQPRKANIFLLIPGEGVKVLTSEPVDGEKGWLSGSIILDKDSPEGLYVITAVHGEGTDMLKAKGSFICGKVVMDYAIMSNFDEDSTLADMEEYVSRFINLGGNALNLHANMATEKVWGGTARVKAIWASKVCKNAVPESEDRLEMMLDLADRRGIPSIISVSWDFTDSTLRNTEYMDNIEEIIDEQWKMFGHHPSLAGFYTYQEGSGTYFASFMREFCRMIKENDSGLLTMCAPNIDDPLLAGYLAAIDDLDIINYQAPIMTSYRPDNRKLFPNRRVKDVTSLSSGATRIRNKITLSHVEFMGYLENSAGGGYLTGYKNIFNQFPSVASAYGPDGITFFNYYTCIYFNSRKLPAEAAEAYRAVSDGLKAYRLISDAVARKPAHVALYVPYSDWCIDRWTNCFLPATDALCRLGISPDIIPFIPKKGEEILPFYPLNLNREQLQYLLDNKYVLILPDISGMQETDSELIETFARNGGAVIAFGPRIPYGDRFDRTKFWGAGEVSPVQNNLKFSGVKVRRSPGMRTMPNSSISFSPVVSSSWDPSEPQRIADFNDKSAAVFSNNYGKGKTYVISLSVNDAVNNFPDLLRDIFDEAMDFQGIKRHFDFYGIIDNMDIASGENGGRYSFMVSNYNDKPVEVTIKPLVKNWKENFELIDLRSGSAGIKNVISGTDNFRIKIDPCDFVALSLFPKNH